MTRYEATYIRKYGKSEIGLMPLQAHAAQVINTSWIYSKYWGSGTDWVDKARIDCDKRISETIKELRKLEEVKSLLSEIDG